MGLKLYGMRQATCTQRVLTTLAEKGIDFELIIVNLMAGEQREPSHLAMQPFGKVPVLDDDGFLIYESRAICKYLARKYADKGTNLIPAEGDPKAYGLFEQACSIEQNYFDAEAFGLWFEKFIKPARGLGATNEENVQKHIQTLDKNLAAYEQILSKQKYLAGDEFTLADLYHLPHGSQALKYGFQGLLGKYPHVNKWWEGIQARDSWKKASAESL
ncbi:putative Glutathione S-transferase [Sclerotinia borealis F-4128]|uniref:glutathione transferase n=1 Tax=Sclerotinia borealis (strain F-4128) TaxID=1432307 RepID=W9C718_SCLBF|nr:putative Glutathione S-transferase [Sclerotinia borealis F-4128]